MAALAVAAITDPRVPPWDRAAVYSTVSWAIWTLVLVPLVGSAGVVVAIRALRKGAVRRSRGICTTTANALVVAAYLPIWSMILAP